MARIITTGPDGLLRDYGEGIFGYGLPDGSLGHSAFTMPKFFSGRVRQGVFYTPYSYKGNEVQEPDQRWVLERRPGIPLYPGSSARGLVLVGPAMGDVSVAGGMFALLVLALGALGLSYYLTQKGY